MKVCLYLQVGNLTQPALLLLPVVAHALVFSEVQSQKPPRAGIIDASSVTQHKGCQTLRGRRVASSGVGG